jgi:lipid II:glycine glycyltransferase (peptidoglycan interpeptide bridge formation enzyme)
MPLETPLAFTLFGVGPFRLAYANFPIGLVTVEETLALTTPDVAHFLRSHGAQILNFSTPHKINNMNNFKGTYLPETLIENLENWEESRLPADVRYKVRRSRREGLQVRKTTIKDSKYLYAFYKATIARRSGQMRYNLEYFQALTTLAEHDQHLNCTVAFSADRNEPCAFIVTAYDGDTAYYLHGGYDARYAHLRSGYGLMSLAIAHARDCGCKKFNLMASPLDQPALVKFKEKWGGKTRQTITYHEPLGFAGKLLFVAIRWRDRFYKLFKVNQ